MYAQPKKSANPLPLFLAVIFGGAVLGAIAFGVNLFFWLIIFFPIALGLVGGFILSKVIDLTKVRSSALAIIAAVVMGVITFGIYQYGNYWKEVRDFHAEAARDFPEFSTAEVDQVLNLALEEETGSAGFIGFMKLQAKEGMPIKFKSSKPILVKGAWFWGLTAIEFLLITGLMMMAAFGAANESFCPACEEWYKGGELLGFAPTEASNSFKQVVPNGNIREIAGLLAPTNAMPRLVVTVIPCKTSPEHPVLLKVEQSSYDRKGNESRSTVVEAPIDGRAVAQFMREQATPNTAVPVSA